MISPFDYQGVALLPSPRQKQFASACDYYFSLSDDDILCSFREAAGLLAPNQSLGGWASRDSSVIFGQCLQAMARTLLANNDQELKVKAIKPIRGRRG